MRIVILADTLDKQYAGVYYYTRGLLDALVSTGDEHEIILIRHRPGKEGWPFREMIVPLSGIPGHASFRLFFTIPRMINKLNPDWVVEPSHFGPFNLRRGIKRATIIHDITPIKMPEMHVWHSQVLQRNFLPRILKRDDRVLVNSEYTRSDLVDWMPSIQDKIRVIYAGRDKVFKPSENREIISRYTQHPYFLYVGTIEPRKDIGTLLSAFEIYKDHAPDDVQLLLCGRWGWKNESLREQLEQHAYRSDIVLTDYVAREELPPLMTGCMAFVYPSTYEGFGLPVLEAMACGAAVITTDVTSLPEVGGDAALYFSPGDISSLSEHMISLGGSEALRTEIRGKSLIQADKYNWDRTASLFLQALNS